MQGGFEITSIKIKEIAQVYSGVRNTLFKNKEKIYEYKVITLNNENNFKIDRNNLETLKTDKELNEKYLLKKGDIIMRLTPPYTAITIDFDDENITTTSNYAIIKVNDDYPPELLAFYLNSEYTKEQIYKFSEQTSIKVINITNIKNFNIKKIDDGNELEKEICYSTDLCNSVDYKLPSNQLMNKNKRETQKQVTYNELNTIAYNKEKLELKPMGLHKKVNYDERILADSMEYDMFSQLTEDKRELCAQLVKTFKEKKELIEEQLKLEKELIEEIVFGG